MSISDELDLLFDCMESRIQLVQGNIPVNTELFRLVDLLLAKVEDARYEILETADEVEEEIE